MRIPDSEHLLTASVGNVDKKGTTQTRAQNKTPPQSEARDLGAAARRWETLIKKIPHKRE